MSYTNHGNVNNLLEFYRNLLLEANHRLNLISQKDVNNVLTRLINDSLFPLSLPDLALEPPVLDLGSGSGIPAIPLKIARPAWPFTLLESNRRKSSFLRYVEASLKLTGIDIINKRFELLAEDFSYHHYFNTVTCRGIRNMSDIIGVSEFLLKPGGKLLLWKGSSFNFEAYSSALSHWEDCRIWNLGGGLKLVALVLRVR